MAAEKSTGRVFIGGVAVFTPPARVRVRKGFIKLALNVPSESLIAGFAPQSLCWSARRGMAGRSDVGAIPLGDIALLRCDPDGSVVVAYWEGGQRGQERQLAFWPDRRQLLSASEVLEEIERWADDERVGPLPEVTSAEEELREHGDGSETPTVARQDEPSVIRLLRALGGEDSVQLDPGPIAESMLQKQTGSWMQNFHDRYPQYETGDLWRKGNCLHTLMLLGWKIGRVVLADSGALDESYRSEDVVSLADATALRFANLDEASWSNLGRTGLALYSGSAVESIFDGPDAGRPLQDDHQRELHLLGEAALRYGVACACAEAGVAGL